MEARHWTCPYCGRASVVRDGDIYTKHADLTIPNARGNLRLEALFIVCPSQECRQFALSLSLHEAVHGMDGYVHAGKLVQSWNLIPPSRAKVFPEYVPATVLADYTEACLICDASPKASATLSRRCLQGIIRDFWKVTPGRLVDEIRQIKDKVDPLTWDAIESVRKVGNIGAHMEKDINVVVDVEPDEANLLIGLIEMLLREWYIATEVRKQTLSQLKAVAETKASEKGSAASA